MNVLEVILTGKLTGRRPCCQCCPIHHPGPAFFVAVLGKPVRPQRQRVTGLTDHRPPHQDVCHMRLECGISGLIGIEHEPDFLYRRFLYLVPTAKLLEGVLNPPPCWFPSHCLLNTLSWPSPAIHGNIQWIQIQWVSLRCLVTSRLHRAQEGSFLESHLAAGHPSL